MIAENSASTTKPIATRRLPACAAAVAAVVMIFSPNIAHAAPTTVFLDFALGGTSFQTRLNDAAASAGLGAGYFTAADATAVQTAIQNEMTNVYNGFNINFTTTPTAGVRKETFADTSTQNVFGLAPFNWRNAFLPGTSAPANDAAISAQIFSGKFGASLAATASKATNIQHIAIGIADTGAHELGHTFGLDHQDTYGDPGITPANYANTGGLQNLHIMASGVSGLGNDRSNPRTFNQLEKAKLAQSNNLYLGGAGIPNLTADTGDNHQNLAIAGPGAAQPITFKFAPIASESVVTVTSGAFDTAGIDDVYSFTAGAGDVLTADILALSAPVEDDQIPGGTFFNTPARTILRLYRFNGGAPIQIVTSLDKEYSGNSWLSGTQVDDDPMILNQPLPANDTYFLDVQSVTTGNYEMFVSVPEPGSLLILGMAGFGLLARRKSKG